MYKFKELQTVPDAKKLIDITLSKTNRKTPTVVHPGFKITRVRSFYMRKVKFCQTTYNEKFSKILTEFPRIDDIHPFYADLCNVLYDRDHYKLALGQVNSVKNIVDSIAKDYVRLMKFADSLYKCKMLKRAALGRMCTAVKKMQASLTYLEEVRQHLCRLPSISPATRTLILTGYPNVGKSSFMNIVSNANVDVQPYAFTTKSLFVGHMDYEFVRWQVIDTPGVLDHPLEERNTIEMTAITALAHLPAAVLYFVDVSEMCGYSLSQQVQLFHSIKPLFKNKPLIVILNKTDLRKVDDLASEEKALLESMKDPELGVEFFTTSCMLREGVDEAKNKACAMLLSKRVETKLKGNKHEGLRSRLHATQVAIPNNRPPNIPESVKKRLAAKAAGDTTDEKMVLERDLEDEMGGAGAYSVDLWKKAQLKDESWKYDSIPEMFDGKNVADYIDPDIEAKLAALEKEEELLLAAEGLNDDDAVLGAWKETQGVLDQLHSRVRQRRLVNRLNKSRNHVGTPRKGAKKASEVDEQLKLSGMEDKQIRGRSTSRKPAILGKRKAAAGGGDDDGSVAPAAKKARAASASRALSQGRSKSRVVQGLGTEERIQTAEKKRRKQQRQLDSRQPKGLQRRNEGDRHIPDFKPKHLYSGKRGIGKADRR
jgi:nucleolar GTP-binding protein